MPVNNKTVTSMKSFILLVYCLVMYKKWSI